VVTGQVEQGVSRFMQHVPGQYAQYFHGRLNRRGRLWQIRFYSCMLDRRHFLTALGYVYLNPQRARLVETAAEYRWSSAAAHVGLTEGPAWPDLAALHGRATASDWAARLGQGMERGELAAIRRATQTECPLGRRVLWSRHFRDCHIEPDWLLICKIDGEDLHLVRTGTHSDLF